MGGGGIALDALGAFAKQFSDNPKVLNILGSASPISKRALNREIASNSPFAINATNALRAGNFKEFHRLSDETVAVQAKNASMNRMSKIQNPTNNEALENLRYPRYQVDETLPFEEQKRLFKGQVAEHINQEWSAGNKIHLPVAYKKLGQLINPETGRPVHLKYKKTDPKTKWRSYEPKPDETTAIEVAKRKGREKPWLTSKTETEEILESVGKKEKLAELLTLIRTETLAEERRIRALGLTKGHRKALANGGFDVKENLMGERGRTVGKVKGNFARQHKNDPSDAVLRKQGGFTGTWEEYVLMKLKQLE